MQTPPERIFPEFPLEKEEKKAGKAKPPQQTTVLWFKEDDALQKQEFQLWNECTKSCIFQV